jgi:hypothetical protein
MLYGLLKRASNLSGCCYSHYTAECLGTLDFRRSMSQIGMMRGAIKSRLTMRRSLYIARDVHIPIQMGKSAGPITTLC